VSKRYALGPADVVFGELSEHALDYSRRVGGMVTLLTEGFSGDAVNIVMAHATLLGGEAGGGERQVQTILDYVLPAGVFPASAHYAALGHLHRQQEIPAPCPAFYSGSPLPIDFGEEQNEPVVLIVTARPDARAEARPVPVTGGRKLRTLRGTLDQVIAEGEQVGDAWLRVVLTEPGRAGLGDLVREKLPNALEVRLDEAYQPGPDRRDTEGGASASGRSPSELFGAYLAERKVEDPRLVALFAELLDEVTGEA
jgi:exonuclease SbcD